MTVARVQKLVAAILENNGLRYSFTDGEYELRFSSALVHVAFGTSGRQVLIHLRSPVLQEVPAIAQANADLLHALNSMNAACYFGKWVLYETECVVNLEHDLLGDHLQEDELMTALALVAREADHHDDVLQQRFGGHRAFE